VSDGLTGFLQRPAHELPADSADDLPAPRKEMGRRIDAGIRHGAAKHGVFSIRSVRAPARPACMAAVMPAGPPLPQSHHRLLSWVPFLFLQSLVAGRARIGPLILDVSGSFAIRIFCGRPVEPRRWHQAFRRGPGGMACSGCRHPANAR